MAELVQEEMVEVVAAKLGEGPAEQPLAVTLPPCSAPGCVMTDLSISGLARPRHLERAGKGIQEDAGVAPPRFDSCREVGASRAPEDDGTKVPCVRLRECAQNAEVVLGRARMKVVARGVLDENLTGPLKRGDGLPDVGEKSAAPLSGGVAATDPSALSQANLATAPDRISHVLSAPNDIAFSGERKRVRCNAGLGPADATCRRYGETRHRRR